MSETSEDYASSCTAPLMHAGPSPGRSRAWHSHGSLPACKDEPAVQHEHTRTAGLRGRGTVSKMVMLLRGISVIAAVCAIALLRLLNTKQAEAPGALLHKAAATAEVITADDVGMHLQATDMLDDTAPRVALCFFGLSRSLKYTLPSIQKNLLKPLREAGYRPTVFLHTYGDAAAIQIDESSKKSVPDEWRLLKPFEYSTTSQEAFLEEASEPMDGCWRHGTGWRYTNVRQQRKNLQNLLCQLNSLKEVGKLWQSHWEKHPDDYAAVAFVRPDVLYNDPLPVHLIPSMKKGEVYVPAWGSYGGMNDRFAMLHPSSAGDWKKRIDFTLKHCTKEPIHAEMFAKQFAAKTGLTIKWLRDFIFFRVRSDGAIAQGDHILPGWDDTRKTIRERYKVLGQRAHKLTDEEREMWVHPSPSDGGGDADDAEDDDPEYAPDAPEDQNDPSASDDAKTTASKKERAKAGMIALCERGAMLRGTGVAAALPSFCSRISALREGVAGVVTEVTGGGNKGDRSESVRADPKR